MKKKIVIEWDDDVINIDISPKNTVKTPDLVAVLEWVKLSLFEKKEIGK